MHTDDSTQQLAVVMQVADESGVNPSATAVAQTPPAREDGAGQVAVATGADDESGLPVSPSISLEFFNSFKPFQEVVSEQRSHQTPHEFARLPSWVEPCQHGLRKNLQVPYRML